MKCSVPCWVPQNFEGVSYIRSPWENNIDKKKRDPGGAPEKQKLGLFVYLESEIQIIDVFNLAQNSKQEETHESKFNISHLINIEHKKILTQITEQQFRI